VSIPQTAVHCAHLWNFESHTHSVDEKIDITLSGCDVYLKPILYVALSVPILWCCTINNIEYYTVQMYEYSI